MAEFDPGRMARRMQAAGAGEELAEATADEVNGAVAGVATRSDLEVVRADMRADMQTLRADMREDMQTLRAEMRADMEAFRAEMRADMEAFRAEMRTDMEAFRTEMRTELQDIRVGMAALRADFQKELRVLALQLGGFAVGVAGIAVAIVKLA